MTNLTRRSVLRSSIGLAAVGALSRPYIAKAEATTAEAWFAQEAFRRAEEIFAKYPIQQA
jgi:hypothetical protein